MNIENAAKISESDFAELERNGCRPQAGDILFSKDGTIGKVALVGDEEFVVLSSLAILRPSPAIYPPFLSHYLTSSAGLQQIESKFAGAALRRITLDVIVDLALSVPPVPEQQAITEFLDRETAKIDGLVARKERLIELLQEKRTALITRAVTRGLDSSVPMKDSGVEWLGEIPAHWEVKRVRDIAESLQTGPFGSQLHADDYVPGTTPIMNPANLRRGQLIRDRDRAVDDDTATRLSRHRLVADDILIARRGELGRCGLVTLRQEGWLCGTGCLRLRPCVDVANARFLLHMLTTPGVREWLELRSVGSTMQNLNTFIIGQIPIALPTLAEQAEIVTYLDRETGKIDTLIFKVGEALEHLKEFRTALISAAVTGKIDVREEAA